VLPVASHARYGRSLAGHWRAAYVATAMLALYLNVFVLVAQAFLKLPLLRALGPTRSEPPFALTQLAVLALFIGLTVVSAIRFHPGRPRIDRLG
jgi:hypothetical protein